MAQAAARKRPPARAPGSPPPVMRAVVGPTIQEQVDPDYPEAAGRARMIGEARVELLVEVGADGVPVRARPLRGPEPDLGMRQAAVEAALRWRFQPATLHGAPLRYFQPVTIPFQGLPPRSREWVHRALFVVGAIASTDPAVFGEARARIASGAPFAEVARQFENEGGGDWGLVSAADLPGALRVALHDATVGGLAGPVEVEGVHYLLQKRGEVYYAIQRERGDQVTYVILHRRNGPGPDELPRAIDADIAAYFAASRRQIYMDEAARLMGIRQVVTDVGPFRIHTDVLDADEVRVLGEVVQSVIDAHTAFWSPIVALRPLRRRIDLYAFARAADHERLFRLLHRDGSGDAPATGRPETTAGRSGDATGGPGDAAGRSGAAWTASGEYIPASRILAVACEEMSGHLPVTVVIHETIHMLDYERVYDAGARPSQWFEEGLASYFRFSQIDSRLRIDPGTIRRSGVIVAGPVRLQFDPRDNLLEYLRRRADQPVPLRELLEAGPADSLWTGRQASVAYGAAWTLVHFMLHGDHGRRRPGFISYAEREARGGGGPEAFAALCGPDLDVLEAAWHAYEERL